MMFSQIPPDDANSMSVLQYAVEHLRVEDGEPAGILHPD